MGSSSNTAVSYWYVPPALKSGPDQRQPPNTHAQLTAQPRISVVLQGKATAWDWRPSLLIINSALWAGGGDTTDQPRLNPQITQIEGLLFLSTIKRAVLWSVGEGGRRDDD